MTISILSGILTVSTGIKIGAGALLHRIGQAIIAKLQRETVRFQIIEQGRFERRKDGIRDHLRFFLGLQH